MKTIYWVIGLLFVIGGYLVWKFRDRIPVINKAVQSKIPDTFIRKDKFGDVVWSKENNVYTHTFQYGVIAGIPQANTTAEFISAWKS